MFSIVGNLDVTPSLKRGLIVISIGIQGESHSLFHIDHLSKSFTIIHIIR